MQRLISLRIPFLTNSLKRLIIVSGVIAIASTAPAQAETVEMVKDVNQQSNWRIQYSASNNKFAFHFRRLEYYDPLHVWRSTATRTDKVDLSSVSEDPSKIRAYSHTLTEDYLYLWNEDNELWQLDVNSLQTRQVELEAPEFSSYAQAIRNQTSDAVYFLVEEYRQDGVRLYTLDESIPALHAVSPTRVADGFNFGSNALLGDRIIFEGRDSIWSIGSTGENPEKLARISGANGRSNTIVGSSIAYMDVASIDGRCEIWRTDGTRSGTYALADLVVGRPSPPSSAYAGSGRCNSEVTLVRGNTAVFKKINWQQKSIEIWETKGRLATTRLVKSLPYVPILRRVNPESLQLDLRRVGNFIWFKSYARNQRQLVWASDFSFTSLRRVMAARRNSVVDLIPLSDHILIQQTFNGANSSLYQANEDGGELKRISYGRGNFYTDSEYTHDSYRNYPEYTFGQAVAIGAQVFLPYKPPKQSRELLIARDLDNATTSVRQRWTETNESSVRGRYMTTAPNDTVLFCAANGAGSKWQGGPYYERDESRFKTRLWYTDGSSDNTRPIISEIGSYSAGRLNYPDGPCGQFVISGSRIFYTRNTDSLGEELWTAGLDGSNQKPLVDLEPGEASSYPRQIVAVDGGVLVTALPSSSRYSHLPKKLLRVEGDGSYEVLFEGSHLEILAQTGARTWFHTLESNRKWSLWVTDGTAAGTRNVSDNVKGSNFTELNGDTYLLVSLLDSSVRGPRLYKIAADSTQLEFVRKLEPGTAYRSIVFKDRIYLAQTYTNYSSDINGSRIYRYDPATGDATLVVEDAIAGERSSIRSMTVFDDQIYYFVDRRNSDSILESWEVWRSAGEVDDAVRIYDRPLPLLDSELQLSFTATEYLSTTDSSIWFNALDQSSGYELWKLTRD